MKNHICYKVLLISPCCGKQIEIASMDYYTDAIKRRNQIRVIFGKKSVTILKKIRPLIKNKQSHKFYEIG